MKIVNRVVSKFSDGATVNTPYKIIFSLDCLFEVNAVCIHVLLPSAARGQLRQKQDGHGLPVAR